MGKIDFGNAFSKGWQGFTANIGTLIRSSYESKAVFSLYLMENAKEISVVAEFRM